MSEKTPRVDKKEYDYDKKENWKNDTGRPSKYREEYCDDIINYFEKCQAEIILDIKFFQANKNNPISKILNPLADEETEEELKTLNAASVKQIEQKLVMTRFPTITRYARSIGVNKTTIYERAKDHKDFSNSLEECKNIQESILIENGLQWTFNSQFAMFLLKNNHWYKEKADIDMTSKWESIWLTDKQIQAIDALTNMFK